MLKNVLIVASAETFSVRGIEMKLEEIGVVHGYSTPKVNELNTKIGAADLIILYTDDSVEQERESLVYIKDYCAEKELQVMVIGSRIEYDAVRKYLPENLVAHFFERPLEMGQFIDAVEEYFAKNSEEARRKVILIVDDDLTYMSMISDWLKDNYRVSMVNSGVSAITWLAKNRADLILLDYEMPITSGPQVLEMIRTQSNYADVPVMFLTGKGDRESIMKVLSLRPIDYLLKTIDRYALFEKINQFFKKQAAKV